MPLTDEAIAVIGDKFNQEQLVDMLLPEAQTKLSSTHVIRTREEDESHLSEHARRLADADLGTKIGELHTRYEQDVESVTGIKKLPNEKAYAYNKRVLAELKSKSDASGGDEGLKQQIATLQQALSDKETEFNNSMNTFKENAFKERISGTITSELNKAVFSYPAHLKTDAEKKEFADTQARFLNADFLNTFTAKENDGVITFYQGDKAMLNSKDGKPLTASDLITERYGKTYFDQATRQQGGAGSGASSGGANAFTTREQVYDYLKGKGVESMTKEFTDQADKLIKEHGII